MSRRRGAARERSATGTRGADAAGERGAASSVQEFLTRWRASDGRWGVGVTAALLVATTTTTPADGTNLVGGAVLQIAALTALVAWGAWSTMSARGAWRFDRLDGALLALLGWIGLSAWRMADDGCPRLTLNLFWTWGATAATFWLARRFLRTAADCRAIVAVMLAVTVVQSTLGLYQTLYARPRDRAIYNANPERALAEAGIVAPKGSPLRAQFESRLHDTEPLGTFSLTNSLAGLLAPWLTLTLAVALAEVARRSKMAALYGGVDATAAADARGRTSDAKGDQDATWSIGGVIVPAAAALLVAVCLLLTKSRSAYLATLGGMALVVFFVVRGRWRIPRAWLLAVAGATAFAVVGASWFGLLDRQVLTEARKSLGVRWEYWQSTWALLSDHPWFGCGVGNFQNYYATYKLPQASEMVADPHNWFFEMAANAGWPAALMLLGLFVLVAGRIARACWRERGPTDANEAAGRDAESRGAESSDAVLSIGGWSGLGAGVGLLLGLFAAFLSQYFPDSFFLFVAAPLGGVTWWGLRAWVARGRLPAWCVGVALLVLLVNLSAAGSLVFGGVSGTLWLLVALGWRLSELEDGGLVEKRAATETAARGSGEDAVRESSPESVRLNSVLGMAVATAALLACSATSLRPVTLAGAELEVGGNSARRGMLDPAERAFREAARRDPWAPDPWQRLAELQAARFASVGPGAARDSAWEALNEAVRETLRLNRRAYTSRRQLAELLTGLWRQTDDSRALQRADELLSEAVELYPNSNLLWAQRAWIRKLAGRDDLARSDAEQALTLDRQMPHHEQKLSEQRISDTASRFSAQPRPPSGESAEETMRRLTEPATRQ